MLQKKLIQTRSQIFRQEEKLYGGVLSNTLRQRALHQSIIALHWIATATTITSKILPS